MANHYKDNSTGNILLEMPGEKYMTSVLQIHESIYKTENVFVQIS